MQEPCRLRAWVRANEAEIRTGLLGYVSIQRWPEPAGQARDGGARRGPAPVAERPAGHRRERTPEPAVDAEALIKQVVGKLQAQGNAEAERSRDAMRKAMALLASAVGEA